MPLIRAVGKKPPIVRVQITEIFDYANDDSRNRPEAKKKRQRLREFFVVKGELLAVEEGIRES